jgi:hypothetical protein
MNGQGTACYHFATELRGTGPYDAVRANAARSCSACVFRTSQDEAVRERIAKTEFQDRCLKPLGHPSGLASGGVVKLRLSLKWRRSVLRRRDLNSRRAGLGNHPCAPNAIPECPRNSVPSTEQSERAWRNPTTGMAGACGGQLHHHGEKRAPAYARIMPSESPHVWCMNARVRGCSDACMQTSAAMNC